jgi:hypothetical protein
MEEEDPPDGDSLSEHDKGLSEGESSYGDDPQFSGPPNLQRLVRLLGQEHCRCPCRMKNKDSVKVASICGKKVKDCQLHAKIRLGADTCQYTIGSYPPIPVARGFEGHGLASGPYYTDAQIRALQAKEEKEMTQLVQAMNKDAADDGEMEEVSRYLRVCFTPPNTQPKKTQAKRADNTDDLRKALAATGGAKKKKGTLPELWFGMVGKKEVRWITSDPMEAQKAAEAESWIDEEEVTDDEDPPNLSPRKQGGYLSNLDDDSSDPDVDVAGVAKATHCRKKNQAHRVRKGKEAKEAKESKGEQREAKD